MHKQGKNVPFTRGTDNKVYKVGDLYNPDFIPVTLHELFYFEGREFKQATFEDEPVSLSLGYSEQVNFEAGPELNITNFLPNFDVLLPAGPARFEKVEFAIMENKYKITCALREPSTFLIG
jgi:hypothetical protein